MGIIRVLTAGESHGIALIGIIEGLPRGIKIDADFINNELRRRQSGYGRGKRMSIEKDEIDILSGVYNGITTGAPLCLVIKNKDYENWRGKTRFIDTPRPGHADFPGAIKYGSFNVAEILERGSARETAIRTALGAVAKIVLSSLDINVFSYVYRIGKAYINPYLLSKEQKKRAKEENDLSAPQEIYEDMKNEIDKAIEGKYSVGGLVEVIAENVPPGLGSYVHFDRRIDAYLSMYLMSIPSVKAVGFGLGFDVADKYGKEAMDELFYDENKGYYRKTNFAGGIEGGMTNGEDVSIHLAIKPIPTQMSPINTIHLKDNSLALTFKERSDVCVVPAVGVIAEGLVSLVLLDFILQKFHSDNISLLKKDIERYRRYSKNMAKNYEDYYQIYP